MPSTPSNVMANILAAPGRRNRAFQIGGVVLTARAKTTFISADAIGHVYPLIRVPTHTRVLTVRHSTTGTPGGLMNLVPFIATDWNQQPDGISSGLSALCQADLSPPSSGGGFGSGVIVEPDWMNQIGTFGGHELGLIFHSNAVPEPRSGSEYDLCWVAMWEPSGGGSFVTEIDYTVGT